ncbi:MAG: hypothetical protein DI626_11120 [Micavibrio aeruginosavorus]|uniref:Thioredoxin domain-containing protein n=1 Tax=Micavibrio aeruginosavorus TaxID=349221 RepID=A0A2W4ZGX6_9BACT|nr:MAG: hypothetical protein DI626_11120 [Micavibrio aeruginosavorus]
MNRNIAILIALVAATALYTIYTEKMRPPVTDALVKTKTLITEQAAPDFEFTDIKGNKLRLSDFRGQAVIVNFWASWCAPCVVEFPQMVRLAQATKGKSVFIFLSWDEKDEDITRFLKKHAPSGMPENIVIGHDKSRSIAQDLFQTYRLPETYLLTSRLNIADKIIGADIAWDGDAMIRRIQDLSAQ